MAEMQPQSPGYAGGFMPGTDAAASSDVSVAGVLLLTVLAVVLAILGVALLGLVVMGGWWLVSHIPVPLAVRHLLALI